MSDINVCYKERNIGIDLLKAWMAFEVVLCHFGHGSEEFVFKYFFSYFRSMAVPVFMIVSFYLSARFYLVKEIQINKLLQRLKRIYIPLIVWAIIYWIIYNALAYYGGICDLHLSFNDLLWQMFTGHSYNTAMWFNVVLAFLTILFLACKLSSKYSSSVIVLISLLAIFMQSSGLNNVFMSYRSELNFPLGRIAEMIPFAGFGLMLYTSYANTILPSKGGFLSSFLVLFRNSRFLILFILLYVFVGILSRGLYCSEIYDYHYSGIKLFLCSVVLVAVFLFMPMQALSKPVKKVITFLSRYSMGVYCVHMLVGSILGLVEIKFSPFYLSILIYALSLLLCYSISKIPYKLFKYIVM